MMWKLPSSGIVVLLLLLGCGEKEKSATTARPAMQAQNQDLAQRGMEIFRDRNFGKSGIACVDCHAEYPDTLNLQNSIPAGHSILGASRRTETWNGKFRDADLLRTAAGAAKCALIYQKRGTDYITALSVSEASALLAYFDYISLRDEPRRLKWTAVTYPGDSTFSLESFNAMLEKFGSMAGRSEKGAVLYRKACAGCHDRGIGPSAAALRRRTGVVARAVRAGVNTMPFFSRDKLSDADIADIREAISNGIRE